MVRIFVSAPAAVNDGVPEFTVPIIVNGTTTVSVDVGPESDSVAVQIDTFVPLEAATEDEVLAAESAARDALASDMSAYSEDGSSAVLSAANALMGVVSKPGVTSVELAVATAALDAAVADARNGGQGSDPSDPGGDADADDLNAAFNVVAQIAAIGEVTVDSGDAVAVARTAYNALTAEQKVLLPAWSVGALEKAESDYVAALEAALATSQPGHASAQADGADASARSSLSSASGLMPSKFKVKARKVEAKAGKKTTLKPGKAFKVTGRAGKVVFAKVKGSDKIAVSSKGKVTVKKGLKAGRTYKVKVLVVDLGSKKVASSAKTITLKVKVVK